MASPSTRASMANSGVPPLSTRASGRAGAALRAWLFGSAGVIGLAAAELALVLVLKRSVVASVWETQFGLLYLSPAWLAVALVLGGLGASVAAACRPGTHRKARGLVVALLALGVLACGWGLGGGRHLSSLAARGGFALSLAGVAGALAWFGMPWTGRRAAQHPVGMAAALMLLAALASLTNLWVLPRLYPAFHWALFVVTGLASAVAAIWATEKHTQAWRSQASIAVIALSVAAVVLGTRPAARRLASFDNFRLLLVDHAPASGQLVRALALLAPPPPMVDPCAGGDCTLVPVGGSASPLHWHGRDVLLVTIDALRADHVGAYGYERNTTPQIDALASSGVRFEYAYAPTPHTSYSVSSLMTGKYMRPLLLQGMGEDSDTLAGLLRAYGYRTAAFYPPAVFFIDKARFAVFETTGFGFEYRKAEFLEGAGRVRQVEQYLTGLAPKQSTFVWVHLFGPHEPYVAHAAHPFGARDIDRYDSEVAQADATLGGIVRAFRSRSPDGVVIVTADHGEEFGDHGGRYHGTTAYEEQVRVPLVVSAPHSLKPVLVTDLVQTIDILPTLLGALAVPIPPRVRGRDLGGLMAQTAPSSPGLAMAESEEQIMLGQGPHRLICERKLGACRLFDVKKDPGQTRDIADSEAEVARKLRARMHELSSSHGRFEVQGLRADGRGWPAAIVRAAAGDPDAAEELASLLDDADVSVRRRAAELLFQMKREATAPALRLALNRDEDQTVRRWAALSLTRMGQGAPLVVELLRGSERDWRRLAALSLAESGDGRGGAILVDWWKDSAARDYTRSLEILEALVRIKEKDAVWPLTQSLDDVRLRSHIAETLAALGDEGARISLSRAFATERYQGTRLALAKAVVALKGGPEIVPGMVRFLGVPDPMPGGLGLAVEAGILMQVGGPTGRELSRLRSNASVGAELTLVVPKGGNGKGVRLLVRARARGQPGAVVVALPTANMRYTRKGEPVKVRDLPRLNLDSATRISVPVGEDWRELSALAGAPLGLKAGRVARLVVYAERSVEVDALAAVPLADELPPPAPKAWKPRTGAPDAP